MPSSLTLSERDKSLLTVALLALILSSPLLVGEIHILYVQGNSMDPMLPEGSIGICPSADGWDVDEGDVIGYRMQGRLITHKVISTETEYNPLDEPVERAIQPKGVNNSELDPEIPAHLVECRMRAAITPQLDIKFF